MQKHGASYPDSTPPTSMNLMVSILHEKEKENQKEEIKQKEEEIEEVEEILVLESDLCCETAFQAYREIIGTLSKNAKAKLNYFLEYMEPGVIIKALEEAKLYNKRSIGYVEAILNNWLKCGIRTMYDYSEIMPVSTKTKEKEGGFDDLISK